MAGYDAVLDDFGYTEKTEDIFIDWAVANFPDDTTIADGRYGYSGDDLPVFYAFHILPIPFQPLKLLIIGQLTTTASRIFLLNSSNSPLMTLMTTSTPFEHWLFTMQPLQKFLHSILTR